VVAATERAPPRRDLTNTYRGFFQGTILDPKAKHGSDMFDFRNISNNSEAEPSLRRLLAALPLNVPRVKKIYSHYDRILRAALNFVGNRCPQELRPTRWIHAPNIQAVLMLLASMISGNYFPGGDTRTQRFFGSLTAFVKEKVREATGAATSVTAPVKSSNALICAKPSDPEPPSASAQQFSEEGSSKSGKEDSDSSDSSSNDDSSDDSSDEDETDRVTAPKTTSTPASASSTKANDNTTPPTRKRKQSASGEEARKSQLRRRLG
jgi:hypothetical protein